MEKKEQVFLEKLDKYGFQDVKERFKKNFERKQKKFNLSTNNFDIWDSRFSNILWERMLEVRFNKHGLVAISIYRRKDKKDASLTIFVGNIKQSTNIPLVDLFDMEISEIVNVATSNLCNSLLSAFSDQKQQVHYE